MFNLSGSNSWSETDNAPPYSLFGDSNGKYNAWKAGKPAAGQSYTLNAAAWSQAKGKGTTGVGAQIRFGFSNSAGNLPPVADAGSNQTIQLPQDLTTLDGSASNDPDGVIVSYAWVQQSGPIPAVIADPAAPQTQVGPLQAGEYVFVLTVEDNGGATATDRVTIAVTPAASTGPQVISFTLIDTRTQRAVPGFDPIPNGAAIPLAGLDPRRLTIRANTSPETTGSVHFDLRGPRPRTYVDNTAPYSLFDENRGAYQSWSPAPAAGQSYTLTGTAYNGAAATGTAGPPLTIRFSFVDVANLALAGRGAEQENAAHAPTLELYPNPTTAAGVLHVQLSNLAVEAVTLRVYNELGQLVWERPAVQVDLPTSEFPVPTSHLPAGSYFLRVEARDGTSLQGRFIVAGQ